MVLCQFKPPRLLKRDEWNFFLIPKSVIILDFLLYIFFESLVFITFSSNNLSIYILEIFKYLYRFSWYLTVIFIVFQQLLFFRQILRLIHHFLIDFFVCLLAWYSSLLLSSFTILNSYKQLWIEHSSSVLKF